MGIYCTDRVPQRDAISSFLCLICNESILSTPLSSKSMIAKCAVVDENEVRIQDIQCFFSRF